jgi:diguanylate cyclase
VQCSSAERGRAATAESRLLIVDDDPGLHEDYVRCLAPAEPDGGDLRAARDALFGPGSSPAPDRGSGEVRFELVHAYAGAAALQLVRQGLENGEHCSVAFVDMRMPPGWNGVETIRQLWAVDPAVQVVLCTAFSDFTWDKVIAGIGRSDGLHLLRKPFAAEQVRRFAEVLSKKWQLARTLAQRGGSRSPT